MSLFAITDPTESAAWQAALAAADTSVQATYRQRATDFCMLVLAQEMAERLSVPLDDLFHCLSNAPMDMHEMLVSPDGWVMVANYLAREFGCEPWQFRPQVH